MSNENANQAADQVSEQAFWTIPGSTTTVTYSLPLFHDIDFVVNEGYRKIPHGGIEVGGLLFGTIDENGTGIAAFRPIECEHVFGPSLLLSERDLKGVESQIAALASDPDLQGMQLVGWFLAHTRGPLQLTDPELELCDRFFKSPGQLTVLVKPERFQPTLFGFLVRDASGNMGRDASQHAVILPLPGRAGRSDEGAGPVPALKSPKSSSVPRRSARSAQSPVSEPSGSDSEAARPPTGDREAPASPARDATESAMTDAIRSARRRLKFEEARLLAEREEAQAAAPQARPVKPAAAEIGEATEAEP
ncbi:MAG TPA: hypothetical protein VK604_16740, partial [Bryobacteraceae bacterium]|nr:hypothetical protein [Bryobacteraceae bacterium]